MSVDELLESQDELVRKVRQSLGLPRDLYRTVVQPVIRNYAEFVHLLPASRAHHHRGAGGLLHHGLEVAYLAARATEDVIFAAGEPPERRRELELRWRVAVCLAGLTHDVGKPVSDLCVTNEEGTTQWRAFSETIPEWARREKVERYYLRWRDGRHRRHERFAAQAQARVLTPACLDWLAEYGPEPVTALLAAPGMGEETVAGRLVLKADNVSVERDLKRAVGHLGGEWGIPVEKHLLDAMRRLLSSGWRVNVPGARVWVLRLSGDDGEVSAWIVWHEAAREITRLLAQDKVPGIPRDPDTLADILIERDLAVPRRVGEGEFRYWPVAPVIRRGPERLLMLRLKAPELLFSEPPPAIEGRIAEWRDGPSGRKGGAKKKERGRAAGVQGVREQGGRMKDESPVVAAAHAAATEPDGRGSRPNRKQRERMRHGESDDMPPATEKVSGADGAAPAQDQGPASADPGEAGGGDRAHPAAHAVSQPPVRPPAGDGKSQRPRSMPTITAWTPRAPSAPDREQPAPPDPGLGPGAGESGAPDGLSVPDEAREVLERLLNAGKWDEHLFWRPPHVVVAHPAGTALAGDPGGVLRRLADAGIVVRDPVRPLAVVREWGGVRGIVLDARVSERMVARAGRGRPPGPDAAEPVEERDGQGDGRVRGDGPGAVDAGEAVRDAVRELIVRIRSRDGEIPGGVEVRDGGLAVSQAVIGWWAHKSGVRFADLREGIKNHPDILLEGASRLVVAGDGEACGLGDS